MSGFIRENPPASRPMFFTCKADSGIRIREVRMAQDCFIGIDQGSSSTKALAISDQGQVLFQTRRNLPAPHREGDRVEFDAMTILASVQDVLKETAQSARASGLSPAGIGLSCQRSSCLLWDALSREPLSPVLSWRDLRGSDFVDSIRS